MSSPGETAGVHEPLSLGARRTNTVKPN